MEIRQNISYIKCWTDIVYHDDRKNEDHMKHGQKIFGKNHTGTNFVPSRKMNSVKN